MKVDKITIGATVPVVQYGNIMPSVELSDVSLEEGTKVGMKFIGDLFENIQKKEVLS